MSGRFFRAEDTHIGETHDDSRHPTYYRNCRRRNKEPVACVECGRIIEIGEWHNYVYGRWRGEIKIFQVCRHCNQSADIFLSYSARGYAARIEFGGLLKQGMKHARKLKVFKLYRLALGCKRRWAVSRGPRKGQLMPLPRQKQSRRRKIEGSV
jgi:hypothetical protein